MPAAADPGNEQGTARHHREALWLVEPLALHARDAHPGEIESAPAVQLLRDRASAVRKDLMADASTLATMARVSWSLDGMLLAIELAAARLRTISLSSSPTGSTTGSAC